MIVTSFEQLEGLVQVYEEFDEFVFDVETKGPYRLDPSRNEVFWISLAGPGRADTIPMGHPLGCVVEWEIPMRKDGKGPLKNRKPIPHYGEVPKQLWPADVFSWLRGLLFSDRRKIGHNLKFDLQSIAKFYDGKILPPPYGDTQILAHDLDENHRGYRPYSLGSCVSREFKFKYDKDVGKAVETHPFDVAARYGMFDAKYEWLLWRTLVEELIADGLWKVHDLQMSVLPAVSRMELHGVDIDVEAIHRLDEQLAQQIDDVYRRIEAAAGWEINLNANDQVAKLVYDILGHECVMFTEKTKARQTTAKAFEPYLDDPVVADLKEWAELHKLRSTYVTNLIPKLHEGKLHAQFNQVGTATFRFSSSDPNLQNMPIRQSKLIRDLFYAPDGFVLIVADYSQIELRLLAHFTEDPMLMQAYRDGLDLHTLTAQQAYGVDKPTLLQRANGKNTNFAIAYGATWQTINKRYGVPEKEAKKLINAFFGTYVNVAPWIERELKQTYANGVTKARAAALGVRPTPPYVETFYGVRRRLPDLWRPRGYRQGGSKEDFKAVMGAERQAINFKIQGGAAVINKLAISRADNTFKDSDIHLLMTIHDELVALAPEDKAEEGAILLREAMEGVVDLPGIDLRLALPVDVKTVRRWSEAK